MGRRQKRDVHKNENGKYIWGIIASIAVIIASFAIAIWVFLDGQNAQRQAEGHQADQAAETEAGSLQTEIIPATARNRQAALRQTHRSRKSYHL